MSKDILPFPVRQELVAYPHENGEDTFRRLTDEEVQAEERAKQ